MAISRHSNVDMSGVDFMVRLLHFKHLFRLFSITTYGKCNVYSVHQRIQPDKHFAMPIDGTILLIYCQQTNSIAA
jgi:hypothetical protein